jgi:hypothetical protein
MKQELYKTILNKFKNNGKVLFLIHLSKKDILIYMKIIIESKLKKSLENCHNLEKKFDFKKIIFL